MSSKRKADDFIYTLSDNDDVSLEEEDVPEPPRPKKRSKKSKKPAAFRDADGDESVWGKKEDNDDAIDSDFEFVEDGTTDFRPEDFEGWGFDGARKGMSGQRKMVDVDEIVRRRRAIEANDDVEDDEEDDEIAQDLDLDDEDDEVLAADGFGMGAGSDQESEGEPGDGDEDAEGDEGAASDDEDMNGDASDNDSVATPNDHPDDRDQSDTSSDNDDDPEEAAKRAAFFAPEEKVVPGKKAGKVSFQSMSLSRPILRGLNSVGFATPTPIQAKTIPLALEGKDLVGGAVTGSGKTGAFVVPILERLLYRPNKIPTTRVVILAPTRELAIQCHSVATKLASHTDIKFCLAVGGLSLKVQEAELRLRPDVVIATPGRFIDHMRNSASFSIDTIEILVLDEADRMLEDGFADELNEILTTMPKSRQTMLFSATMTSSVDKLIRAGLNKPVRVMVDSQRKTVDKLEQKFVRLRPGREEKRMGYLVHICKTMRTERVIIFFRQKKEAHRARIIFALMNLSCAELHGSMNQSQRIASVEAFRDGKVAFLLATDLASRGLDIKGIDTVINYEGPQSLEIYVHRVGRTARAGRSGVAITLAAEPDRKVVKAVVKAGKAQGAKIGSLVIESAEPDKWQAKIDEMKDEIEAIAKEEKEEKQMAQAEMEIKKGENMVIHEEEIKGRPKRTWFETQHDKKKARDAGHAELNGFKDSLKKKGNGKLSNKDRKKLDARSAQKEGKVWKKGSAERAGKAKLAPPRRFLPPRPHPHHKTSLLQYLFPRFRERYRERLIDFHLDTLPHYKHRFQSRIYRLILEGQRRRREQVRIIDRARRLILGLPAPRKIKNAVRARSTKMNSTSAYGVGSGNYGADSGRQRGGRRQRLAAMAGSMYRAGAGAVNEIKESYNQTRVGQVDSSEASKITIPGSFPDVAIITKGNEQMVLFPSYAKRHVKGQRGQYDDPAGPPDAANMGMNEQDYWRYEWARHEDEKAIVDVDIRGWIYNPHRGPMTRRNRILIGLARQLSGIPAPRAQQGDPSADPAPSLSSIHQQHEEERERESIARQAQMIESRGQAEKEAAQKGGYSERPKDEASEDDGDGLQYPGEVGAGAKSSASTFTPATPKRSNTAGSATMNDAELALANANLMGRIAPFMTTPLVDIPITLFFYNDVQSQSRTIMTDDSGHFVTRVGLDFVPTHVRVLANEDISYTEPVQVIEPRGVSLISDIDDTIKQSNIALGTKEIFRNTFVRELNGLTVDGVRKWYNSLYDLGVKVHYCSNSPWQLYPVIATYFKLAGLPPGSLHLKRYSGMLQGIFEPVAERKKGTLEKIMNDFPERKFLLVGDSGEADLEVYTELAVAYPGRIVAIFIRDVTTPEQPGYFDSGFDTRAPNTRVNHGSDDSLEDVPRNRPGLPPRMATTPKPQTPVMGDLIDFSDEPKPVRRVESDTMTTGSDPDSRNSSLQGRKPPPLKPVKPSSLQSQSSSSVPTVANKAKQPPPPPQPRRSSGQAPKQSGPVQASNATESTLWQGSPHSRTILPPPPPPPRRRGTPSNIRSLSPHSLASQRRDGDVAEVESLYGSSSAPSAAGSGMATPSGAGGNSPNNAPINKKLDMWRRRLERAHDTLDQRGIPLYTWRRGEDVIAEAQGIVKENLKQM
ncbi:hypothetical protein F5Y15DRAFT_407341 [Xylariaceae sp. FL0016]|nr:hypothetical protein F5Y15DRAFT_407341 [Xylariaceae sp. FL0016]